MPEKDYYYLYQKYKNKYLNLKGGTRFTDIPHDLHGLAISNASSVDIIKICLKFNTRYRRDFNDRNICDRIDWRNLLRDRYNIVDMHAYLYTYREGCLCPIRHTLNSI